MACFNTYRDKCAEFELCELGPVGESLRRQDAKLRLNQYCIGTQRAVALMTALASCPFVSVLDAPGNALGDAAATQAAAMLRTNTTITRLNLSYNKLTGRAMPALAAALRDNSTLMSLALQGNPLADSTKAIFEAMTDYKTPSRCRLKVLDVAHTRLGDVAARALATLLSMHCQLEKLELSRNCIVTAWDALGAALASNVSLKVLGLSNNSLGGNFVEGLCQALTFNQSLDTVVLSNCPMAEGDFAAIDKLLEGGCQLTHLVLDPVQAERVLHSIAKLPSCSTQVCVQCNNRTLSNRKQQKNFKLELPSVPPASRRTSVMRQPGIREADRNTNARFIDKTLMDMQMLGHRLTNAHAHIGTDAINVQRRLQELASGRLRQRLAALDRNVEMAERQLQSVHGAGAAPPPAAAMGAGPVSMSPPSAQAGCGMLRRISESAAEAVPAAVAERHLQWQRAMAKDFRARLTGALDAMSLVGLEIDPTSHADITTGGGDLHVPPGQVTQVHDASKGTRSTVGKRVVLTLMDEAPADEEEEEPLLAEEYERILKRVADVLMEGSHPGPACMRLRRQINEHAEPLREIFIAYRDTVYTPHGELSARDVGSDEESVLPSGVLNMRQQWLFLRDAKLPSSTLSFAEINRITSVCRRINDGWEIQGSYETLKERAGKHPHMADKQNDTSYGQWLEMLIRLSWQKYRDKEKGVGQSFEKLVMSHIPHLPELPRLQGLPAEMARQEFTDFAADHRPKLLRIFRHFALTGQGEKPKPGFKKKVAGMLPQLKKLQGKTVESVIKQLIEKVQEGKKEALLEGGKVPDEMCDLDILQDSQGEGRTPEESPRPSFHSAGLSILKKLPTVKNVIQQAIDAKRKEDEEEGDVTMDYNTLLQLLDRMQIYTPSFNPFRVQKVLRELTMNPTLMNQVHANGKGVEIHFEMFFDALVNFSRADHAQEGALKDVFRSFLETDMYKKVTGLLPWRLG